MQPHTTTTVEPIDQVSESWLPVIYESPALDLSKIPTEALRSELKKRAEAALKKQALHMHIDPLLLLSGKLVNKAAICYGLDPKRVTARSPDTGTAGGQCGRHCACAATRPPAPWPKSSAEIMAQSFTPSKRPPLSNIRTPSSPPASTCSYPNSSNPQSSILNPQCS